MALVKDIDWMEREVRSTAVWALDEQFKEDPLMSLLDANALRRLSSYIVNELATESASSEKSMNMYQAANWVSYFLLPKSIYAVFGNPFMSHVGWMVQKGLYPVEYTQGPL